MWLIKAIQTVIDFKGIKKEMVITAISDIRDGGGRDWRQYNPLCYRAYVQGQRRAGAGKHASGQR